MGTTQAEVLGDFFANREFPEDQKNRIAVATASAGSLCGRVLRAFALKTTPYREGFARHQHIPGARAGTKYYRARALERILQWLQDDDWHGWDIYRASVMLYIKKELLPLDNLLAEVPVPARDIGASEALKTLCSRAAEFGVSTAQILEFYELWGIDRVETFETAVEDWTKPDEAAQQRRLLAALLKDVGTLKLATGNADAKASSLEHSLAFALERLDDYQTRHKALDDAQHRLSEAVTLLVQKVDSGSKTLEALGDRDRRLGEVVAALQRDAVVGSAFKNEAERIKESAKVAAAAAASASRAELESSLRGELVATRSALEHQLSALASGVSGALDGDGRAERPPRYRSPLLRTRSYDGSRANITEELAFAQSFAQRLRADHEFEVGFELALAYHRGFLANRVIVADWPLAKAWLDSLEWQAFAVGLAANPTWSTEEHWAEGAAHVFRDSASPRFTVIHNYDVGLVDCYLNPSLRLWYRQAEAIEPLAKLFLVPSGDGTRPTSLLAEYAFVCDGEVGAAGPLSLREGVHPPAAPPRAPAYGVAPATVLSWSQSSGAAPSTLDRDLRRIQTDLGCRFGADLTSSVRNTAQVLSKYFSDASAVRLALDWHVAPWVHSKFDGEKDSNLRGLIAPLQSVAE